MNPKFCWLITAILLISFQRAEAQQTAKIPRIGFISVSGNPKNPGFLLDAFRHGLRDLGYIEGKNILVEYRYAAVEPERAPDFVAELIQLNVDVLVSSSAAATRVAQQATKTIPIIMLASFDPVEAGAVVSLAHPGGNITGITRFNDELTGKRLELLKEAVPKLSRIGVLAGAGASKTNEAAARELRIPFVALKVSGPKPDIDGVFQAATNAQVNGLVIIGNSLINPYRNQIVELANKNRLPSMFAVAAWVESGGLMSYSPSDTEPFRRAATYVDKILKGAKPADLPVEQPTKFELVINLKTAKQLGLIIPPNVLARADKVIK
jgi:putative tryptophan/tyrosine transport system substrate-binding protein